MSEAKSSDFEYPFILGGLAGALATCCTHPLDLLKVRLQVYKSGRKSMSRTAIDIVSKQGFIGLYDGLSASVLRQLTYGTARIGFYESLKNVFCSEGHPPSFQQQVIFGITSGCIGSIVGNPADITNVRMQAAGAAKLAGKPVVEFKHVFDGLYQISRNEGVSALWNGWIPNMIRGMLMTATQLVTYDRSKSFFLSKGFKDVWSTHFMRSSCSVLVTSLICTPVDVLKTRVMNSTTNQGLIACTRQLFREGPLAFYKGLFPIWIRSGPQTICLFLFLEKLRLLCQITGLAKPKKRENCLRNSQIHL
eukprot:TRINITY_DN4627_c0_g1_i1.p1 TRINITY_DN4627_c0_g1~~TRINITY_DN4627_c0_g1_i1.p1  ORF type:complete len:329 (-),score=59.78 TRINITY_DN4627_c0_g1_i1:69-986(-)